ncbi:MAG: hypothetical protein V1754_05755 [Pseudomonadota bacterium]
MKWERCWCLGCALVVGVSLSCSKSTNLRCCEPQDHTERRSAVAPSYDVAIAHKKPLDIEPQKDVGKITSKNQATRQSGNGHILYTLTNDRAFRVEAKQGARPRNISSAMNRLARGSGKDEYFSGSADGKWYVMASDRFGRDCKSWSCLSIVAADLSGGEAIRAGEKLIHPRGQMAVAKGAQFVVFADKGSSHELDLYVTTRTGRNWSKPKALTHNSPYKWNDHPAISSDASKIAFDCGPTPYSQEGTAICEVGTDGNGLRIVLTPDFRPKDASKAKALHHPSYAPDGSIVFEGDWDGEQIWRLSKGSSVPVRIAPRFSNDNSPCVLPDGRIVSLWLERSGGRGVHELKIMNPDGTKHLVLLPNVDVQDVGISCGD